MVTSTEHPFRHQCDAHSIEETEVFGNPILLKKQKAWSVERYSLVTQPQNRDARALALCGPLHVIHRHTV